MTKIYDKPFLTYEEQVDYLHQNHNITILDRRNSIGILSTMSYYDLINGYKECFAEGEIFTDGMTLEYLYLFHHFDKSFQSVLFKYSVYVEKIFKNALAYIISKNYGVDAEKYLDITNYTNCRNPYDENKLKETIRKIKYSYTCDKRYLKEPTKHYVLNRNHVPPWILFKNITFNNSIDLYRYLNGRDKTEVCEMLIPNDAFTLNDKKELLKNSLTVIRKYRNNIAHNLSFITFRTEYKILDYKKFINTDYEVLVSDMYSLSSDTPYSMIIALMLLLNNNPHLVSEMFSSIYRVIYESKNKKEQDGFFDTFSMVSTIPTNIIDRYFEYLEKTND